MRIDMIPSKGGSKLTVRILPPLSAGLAYPSPSRAIRIEGDAMAKGKRSKKRATNNRVLLRGNPFDLLAAGSFSAGLSSGWTRTPLKNLWGLLRPT